MVDGGSSFIHLVQPEHWMKDAACRGLDPKLFFPVENDMFTTRMARRVCESCPVHVQCGDYANRFHINWGVWDGKNRNSTRANGDLRYPVKGVAS